MYAAHRVLAALSWGRAGLVPYAFFVQPIGGGTFEALRDDPNTHVAVVCPGDPIEKHFPRPAHIIRERFAIGNECYSAKCKGEFAGYIWIARDQYIEDEVACTYVLTAPQCSVWDFDVFVEPRLRIGRTMGRMWKAVDKSLSLQGITWSFSRISLFNPGSLAAHRRLGAESIGWATFIVIGPVQFSVASLAPRIHLAFNGRSPPSFQLSPPAQRQSA